MKKEDKINILDQLTENFKQYKNLVFADVSDLTVAQTTELRKLCYKHGIKLQVSKNTFIRKALERISVNDEVLYHALKGPSSVLYAESISGAAKLIKDFRRTHKKPILKAAYIDDMVYVGDENLELLATLKSKEELIADLVAMLNSPMINLIGALNSGKNNITGVLKTLTEKGE
jgi:large subunit ribosomal protein L10